MERSDLDILLTEEQTMLRDTVRGLAAERVAPHHEHLDHAAVHPEELVAGMAELGLFGILVPADQGGVGMGALAHAVAVEELAQAGGLAGAILAAHGIATDALVGALGADDLRAELCAGAKLGALALQETQGGVETRAEGSGASARLTGEKAQVPFPGRVGAYLVLARDGAGATKLYCVAGGAPGTTHEGVDRRLGLLGFETATLRLDGAPATELGGAALVERVFTSARIQVAALLVGIGRGAISHGLRYAQERKQFEMPLLSFVAMQERLARADARVESCRALTHGAARLADRGEPCGLSAMRARYLAGDAALSAADDVVQVYGGYGYSREYPAERFYRDAAFNGFGEAVGFDLVGGIARALG